MKTFKIRKLWLAGSACVGLLLSSVTAFGANWLTLQGTEPPGAEQLAKVWGFVQVQYQDDSSDPNPAGGYIPPKLIAPDWESQSAFNVNRARIGVRGVAMPLDQKINYFLLLEMGNNGITEPGNSFAKMTDASVTFNHLKGARVRAGLFKYPGSEEGLQAIHVFDYINFTWVTGQMMLERFPNRNYTPNIPAQPIPPEVPFNGFENGVGAFRDVGVQVFDWFKVAEDWEISYAAMVGNGNGLNWSDNDDNKDFYLYASSEKVFGGKGPRRQGLKFFAWMQNGTRTADLTNDGIYNPAEYDRDRWGVGAKFLRKGIRVTAEYLVGEGMIWQAPHNPSFGIGPGQGNPNAPGNGANAEGKGFYVEGGYRFPGTKWELDIRYDEYNRLDGDRFEIDFDRTTLGVQYFFNPRVRAAFNYEFRGAKAPNFPSGAGPNANVDGIGDRIGIQITAIWSQ
ncbi:porin [Pseudomonadota bacterium]